MISGSLLIIARHSEEAFQLLAYYIFLSLDGRIQLLICGKFLSYL